MKKLLKALSSPILMTVLLLLLIVSLAAATFIENDFGAEVAKLRVYNSKWLEAILVLLSINLIARAIKLKLYKLKKISVFLFHIAFVVMIIGAGITRYYGYEGSMHIREGQSSATLVTKETNLSVSIIQPESKPQQYHFKCNLEQTKQFKRTIKNKNIQIHLEKKIKSAFRKAVKVDGGHQIIGYVLTGTSYSGFDYLTEGETKHYGNFTVSFNTLSNADIQFHSLNDSLFITSSHPIQYNSIDNSNEATSTANSVLVENKKTYKIDNFNFVIQEYHSSAKIIPQPTGIENRMRGLQAMVFNITNGTNSTDITLWEDEWNNETAWSKLGNLNVGLYYGNRTIELPFTLYLDDFVIERYPGSMSPSSFSSYVLLKEEGKDPLPYHIYMNNILKHKGYRFYQSSYDQDEGGTILSVNHDKLGTGVTYFSYLLLLIGILLSIINPNTFFRKTVIRKRTLIITLCLLFSGGFASFAQGQQSSTNFIPVDKKHAEAFGELYIQNNSGRTEPVYTYASELIRKISRKEKMFGLTPVQLFLELNINPNYWLDKPIIQVSNKELQDYLGLTRKYAAYTDIITQNNKYLLQQMVQTVYAKPPAQRSKFDKAIIKTDEKINIYYGILSGQYLKILPVPESNNQKTWHSTSEASQLATNIQDSVFLSNILPYYFEEIDIARVSKDYSTANEYLNGLKQFQRKNAGYKLPSNFKTAVEIQYNKQNPFKKLFPFYATLGIVYLLILLAFIVMGKTTPKLINRVFFFAILLGFAAHTLGIAARWYISGHAPMSNGYETMTFIAWVTLLAGFNFNKRSVFSLTATAVLAGLTLMVANLSFMDPQITNLVPVLQSYWLTIHVSVITASYAFLGLGAILGIINLTLIILRTDKNQKKIIETIESLTIINHKTLILGLYFLTIGTFLGAIWANESWGRYWGWDPKETWALISVLVYTLVTHARLIPGLKGIFAFNALSLFGFSSILMTFFGVNYYLSGLHSYAGGDPVPIPSFVYYTIAAIILLTLGASIKYRKFGQQE